MHPRRSRRVEAERALRFSHDALRAVPEIGREYGLEIDARIGLSAGLVATGVLGSRQLSFDMWGSSVRTAINLAARTQHGTISADTSVVDELPPDVAVDPVDGAEGEYRVVVESVES